MLNTRVEIPAHLDRWMMGDRYGVIVALFTSKDGTAMAKVQMDKSARSFKFPVDALKPLT